MLRKEDRLPTVIESGEGKEKGLDFLPENTVIHFKFVQCHPRFNAVSNFLHREEEVGI